LSLFFSWSKVSRKALASAPGSLAASLAAQANPDRTTILARAARVTIDTPVATGSITLRGGRIDDLKLTKYRQRVDQHAQGLSLQGAKVTELDLTALGISGNSHFPMLDRNSDQVLDQILHWLTPLISSTQRST
jgi:YidC/Oxa1 family membrane protein insertase